MKKTKQITTTLLVFLIVLISCSSSMKSDAQELADMQCKVQKLMANSLTGDISSLEETQKLLKEIEVLTTKMQRKYSSFEEQQKFTEVLSKAKANCD